MPSLVGGELLIKGHHSVQVDLLILGAPVEIVVDVSLLQTVAHHDRADVLHGDLVATHWTSFLQVLVEIGLALLEDIAFELEVDLEVEQLLTLNHVGDEARFGGLLERLLEGSLEGGTVKSAVSRLDLL